MNEFSTERRGEYVGVNVGPSIKRALVREAARTERTISGQLRQILRERYGIEPADEKGTG